MGARGASGFCPEPGLASAIFVLLILALLHLYKEEKITKLF